VKIRAHRKARCFDPDQYALGTLPPRLSALGRLEVWLFNARAFGQALENDRADATLSWLDRAQSAREFETWFDDPTDTVATTACWVTGKAFGT
jgi:hypothetical protein